MTSLPQSWCDNRSYTDPKKLSLQHIRSIPQVMRILPVIVPTPLLPEGILLRPSEPSELDDRSHRSLVELGIGMALISVGSQEVGQGRLRLRFEKR